MTKTHLPAETSSNKGATSCVLDTAGVFFLIRFRCLATFVWLYVSYSVLVCTGVVRHITWKSVERRSVIASTADIQVNANSGRTTQELHRDALSREKGKGQRFGGEGGVRGGGKKGNETRGFSLNQTRRVSHITQTHTRMYTQS